MSDERLAQLTAQHFPRDVVRPWQRRAREVLGPRWKAYVLPVVAGVEVFWTLRRQEPYVELHDPDQEKVLELARVLDLFLSGEYDLVRREGGS